jgi:hypothetical protein
LGHCPQAPSAVRSPEQCLRHRDLSSGLQVAQVCLMAADWIPPDTPDMASGERVLSPQFERDLERRRGGVSSACAYAVMYLALGDKNEAIDWLERSYRAKEGPIDAHMAVAILPASAVKHSVSSVIACDIVDQIPMSEIGIVVSKRVRAAVVDNFRSFALKSLGRARNSLSANRS